MKYDYKNAVIEDVRENINDHIEDVREFIKENEVTDVNEVYEFLYDDMFVSDSVTGNASGSYTFNTYQAEENICHNLDLLGEACAEFGSSADLLKDGAEACDVTIRCYLLSECLNEVLGDMWESFKMKNYAITVEVAKCNADTFKDNYGKYITKESDYYFDNVLFEMEVPENIKNEIEGLEEEMIYINDAKEIK